VSEERLRIARDLHDVLGHRLAAIALKSDLARRLLPGDPDRAATEMAEAGAVAREALDEVRATVSGFREASLAGELGTARALLVAAGVEPVVLAPDRELPRAAAEVAGWVVREGVTNVVRHAHASRVRIKVVAGDPVVVEVADDGRGLSDPGVCRGNGLTGLTERVSAAGGRLEVGAVDGMFRLRAEIPAA
jgi:two-component system sensor histidine kinase DesK